MVRSSATASGNEMSIGTQVQANKMLKRRAEGSLMTLDGFLLSSQRPKIAIISTATSTARPNGNSNIGEATRTAALVFRHLARFRFDARMWMPCNSTAHRLSLVREGENVKAIVRALYCGLKPPEALPAPRETAENRSISCNVHRLEGYGFDWVG